MSKRLFLLVVLTAMALRMSNGSFLPKLPKLKLVESLDSDADPEDAPHILGEKPNPFKLPKLFDLKLKPLKPFSLKDLFVDKDETLKEKIASKISKKSKEDKEYLLDDLKEAKAQIYDKKKSKLADKQKLDKEDWLDDASIKDIFENKKLKNLKLKDLFDEHKLKNLIFPKKKQNSVEIADDDEHDEDAESSKEKCQAKYALKYIKPKVLKKKKCNSAEGQRETWRDPRYESNEYEIKYFS